MPRTSHKTLTFPLAGVSRRGGYREQTRPFSAPWAVNVRGTGALESRERGGSRPGLSKVCATDLGSIAGLFPLVYLDSSGGRQHDLVYIGGGSLGTVRGSAATESDGSLQTAGGVTITTEDGTEIVFPSTVASACTITDTGAYSAAAMEGRLYLADSVLRVYNPVTGVVVAVVASSGTVPTGQPLVCNYRGRLVLGGANHLWYASRQGDASDWHFGADMDDRGRAVAGQVALAGHLGDVPTAMVPVQDKALVFACANSLWSLRGDPTDGAMAQISDELGVIAPGAWAVAPDGMMAFLSNDGVYMWGAGSSGAPVRFSEERVPGELREVSATTNTISMAYDPRGRGFHLFITPSAGAGTHWWLDVKRKAAWPVVMQADHQPTAVARVEGTGLADVVLGCSDGYLRKFDPDATDDDGTSIESHVLIGPIRIAGADVRDSRLDEIHGIMADLDGSVTWRVVLEDSAEAAVDAAVAGVTAALAGSTPAGVAGSGTWSNGRNRVARPRARGMWVVVWISSTTQWAYEAVAMVSRQLGRTR